jgi:hypothetical protein
MDSSLILGHRYSLAELAERLVTPDITVLIVQRVRVRLGEDREVDTVEAPSELQLVAAGELRNTLSDHAYCWARRYRKVAEGPYKFRFWQNVYWGEQYVDLETFGAREDEVSQFLAQFASCEVDEDL